MERRWLKGNLHTHTSMSDGDSPPAEVTGWYRDAGYDFLAITDHNVHVDPAGLAAEAGPMLLIGGEEVTSFDTHVNGLGIRETIPPGFGEDVRATWQADIDAIRAAGGVPAVNHPNFRWVGDAGSLAGLTGVTLLEVWNGSPECNDRGRPGSPSSEELWDLVLTAGTRLWALATDDAHHFRRWGRAFANPGRGWVVVHAQPTEAGVLAALERGDHYASSGVELADLRRGSGEIALEIVPLADLHYTTRFIGSGGRVLDVVEGTSARYRIRGDEGYVRARVDDSDGSSAWVQPLFAGDRPER